MEISRHVPAASRPHGLSRSGPERLLAALSIGLFVLLLGAPLAAQPAGDVPDPEAPGLRASERIETLIARIEYEQHRLETLRSTFTQRKESELLLEPEVSKGDFWYRAPDAVRWDFREPQKTRVVAREGTMLTWFVDQGTAERVDVGGKADQVMEYLSATNSLETLKRYFTIQAVFPKGDTDPYQLKLKPRFKRVKKRLESMEIHLDRTGYFPVYVHYVEPGGDRTEFTFEGVVKNVELGDEIFELDLPEDVEVRTLELAAP